VIEITGLGAVEEQSATTNEISRSISNIADAAAGTTKDVETLVADAGMVTTTVETPRQLVRESDI
jgi:methyl-accepting chemotaxis protein